MKKYLLAIGFLLICGVAWASNDYVKVRYHPGYDMSGYTMDVMIEDSFDGRNVVISNVYQKLKELEKSGRLDYAWPDAPLLSIEVNYKGEVIKSSISPNISDGTPEFKEFSRLWNDAYAIAWNSIEKKLKP